MDMDMGKMDKGNIKWIKERWKYKGNIKDVAKKSKTKVYITTGEES